MENVLLAVSLLSCVALIISVLLQRSEGGALGMGGGGGGGGGLVSSRGAADTLVKATMVLAAIFLCSSLALTRLNADSRKVSSDVERTLSELPADGTPSGDLISDIEGSDVPKDLISEALDEAADESEIIIDEAAEAVSEGAPTSETSEITSENP